MVRDLLGRRVKDGSSLYEQSYMERFYLYNDKIFQIVRLKRKFSFSKNKFEFEISFRNVHASKVKIKRVVLNEKNFNERKFFFTYSKALSFLRQKCISCPIKEK